MGAAHSVLGPAGPQAAAIADVTWWFFAICAVVYTLVLVAVAWALTRKRTAEDDQPTTSRRLARAVTGATIVTAAVLVVLVAVSVSAGRGLSDPRSSTKELIVDVIGRQWWWEFRYHGSPADQIVSAPNELHVPVGRRVYLRTLSRDVIHSFWVPSLHGKRDLIPAVVSETWIQADRAGVFRGQCAEFCGHQHAHMAFLVVAEPSDQFDRWLAHQRTAAPSPVSAAAVRGRDIFMSRTCVMCHAIQGSPAGSRIGPDLTHLASRTTIGAGTLPRTRDNLARWIVNSQEVKPGNRMPPHPLPAEDVAALVSYMETLR
jgi:cytochrome c oxidase subunit 2